MLGGKSFQIYDAENIRPNQDLKRKLDDIPQTKQRRRPLGDICNILQSNKCSKKDDVQKTDEKQDLEKFVIYRDSIEKKEQELEASTTSLSPAYSSVKIDLEVDKRDYFENNISPYDKLYGLTEYVDDVYKYLKYLEGTKLIGKDHLDGTELTKKTRAILVDWMIEVHSHFTMCQETLELSVYILNKYSELKRNVNKRNAQVVALVCIFLAAKYEELEQLEISDIVFVTDAAVSQKDIIRFEKIILKVIEYDLSMPLPIQFLRRYSKVGNVTPMEHAYAMYFCDAALLEYSLCHIRPSILAAAALFLALCISKNVIDIKLWSDTLVKHSTYNLTDFYHLLPRIASAVKLCATSKLDAVCKKHNTLQTYYVSRMPGVQPTIKGSIIEHFC